MKLKLKLPALFAFCAASLLVNLAGVPAQTAKAGDDFDEQSKIARGFAIAPVPLNLKKKNRALVGLGSYIVNAQGGCNDCHTNPPYEFGGDPHLGEPEKINQGGYLAGGQAFGPFISRNLTPNAQGLPAGLTLKQFLHVMRTGEDLKRLPPPVPAPGHDLLQVMPWPVYRKMTDRDLTAVYEYLRAIPSLPGYPE
jgi:hypothetical protein